MPALQTRPEPPRVEVTGVGLGAAADGPLDGLVADAHEVAVALTALRAHSGRRAVRIPAQAFGIVEDLGSYGA